MTIEEVGKYKKELEQIINRFNNRSKPAFDITLDILNKLESLAKNVGASKCIGACYFLIAPSLNSGEDDKTIPALEAQITELIFGINNALQTESMLIACVSAEGSTYSAKWACILAAVAAGVSLLGTIAAWITIFKK